MDLIAEILETDRLAEERLKEAEAKCRQMLEDANNAKTNMESGAERGEKEYSEKLCSEFEAKKADSLREVREKEKADIAALEELFANSGSRWAQEIFERITAVG